MKVILITALCLISIPLLSQEEDIQALNKQFSDRFEFSLKKKGLSIDFIKNGEVFREEFMVIREVDWKGLDYSEESKALVIPCQSVYGACIDRKIIKTKSRQSYPRTSLLVNSRKEAEDAMKLLRNLFQEEH